MDDCIASIARREQNLERGALAARFGELPAVHSTRQPNIGEKQTDFGMILRICSARCPLAASRTV